MDYRSVFFRECGDQKHHKGRIVLLSNKFLRE
jgi:hypothetical protein